MADVWYNNVIERFFKEALDPVLHNFVYNGYATMSQHLKTPLGLAVILYIGLMGLSICAGWVQQSLGQYTKSAFKIGLIYSFAMNWGYFSQWMVDGIQGSAGEIGNWLLAATPIAIPKLGGTGIEGALQSVFSEIVRMAQWTFDSGAWNHPGPYFGAIILAIFGTAVVAVGFFEIVLAKIMLAILFATAPLFIAFTLFKPTHSFFDRWLGQIMGFSFLMIFIMVALALCMSFMQWAIGDTYNQHASNMTLFGFIPIVLVSLLGIGLLIKVSHTAQAIGGAVSTTSGHQLLAGTVGGFIGASLNPKSSGRQLLQATAGVQNKMFGAAHSMVSGIRNRLRGGK